MIEEESVCEESFSEEAAGEEAFDDELMEAFDECSEWKTLKNHPDYEICISYPHQIRKKSNGMILKESIMNIGYLSVHLNGKTFYKHRLIALQFIPNPDNKPCIDHLNHLRTDNRIENLRWCSKLQNNNNKGKSWTGREIEYVQELPDEVIVVNHYHQYHFDGYYFSNDVFYKDTGNSNYRIIPWIKRKDRPNTWLVNLTDTNTIKRTISKGVFYHIYGLD